MATSAETLGQRVRRLRITQAYTLAQLADRVGIARSGIQEIEADERSPRIDTVRALADALGVSLDELAGE